MIDEHKEEMASLYALGLMEPQEAHAFEAELRGNEELRKFVDDLLQHSTAMAHAVPARTAPSHLREKILQEICGGKRANNAESGKVIPFSRPVVWLPWAIAACLMVVCGWQYTDRNNLSNRIASLMNQNDVCQMNVAMLDSMNKTQHGNAMIVWDSSTQTGVIRGRNMPRPAANEDYQLWVLDERYSQPVNAGVISVDDNGRTTTTVFKPQQKVSPTDKFAISLEKKGGAPQHQGPIVMMSGDK